MTSNTDAGSADGQRAWVVTGPTSGIGRETARALAAYGTVVLVGRSADRLRVVADEIVASGRAATVVVGDFSDVESARRAAAEVAALGLAISGVVNNAGIFPTSATTPTARGWDLTYATNHLGPFAFTEALVPHLPDGTCVLFVVSAVEDPRRRPAVMAGFRGARYVSAEASAKGEWLPGGSTRTGYDAYATSKQGGLATVLALAREVPRLRFAALEPGLNPGTSLGADAPAVARFLARAIAPLGAIVPTWSTPARAAKVVTGIVTATSGRSGEYFDERGRPMRGSAQVHDPAFTDRVVAETRALLASEGT